MICPNCGVLLPEDITVCGKCGYKFGESPDLGKTLVEGEVEGESDLGRTAVEEEMSPETVVFETPEDKPPFGWLVVVEGPERWREFRLPAEEGQYLLGRDASCFVRLSDPNVERFHASLRLRGEALFITDLDTDGKTLLNGEPVVREEVPDGAMIQVGKTKLKFRRF